MSPLPATNVTVASNVENFGNARLNASAAVLPTRAGALGGKRTGSATYSAAHASQLLARPAAASRLVIATIAAESAAEMLSAALLPPDDEGAAHAARRYAALSTVRALICNLRWKGSQTCRSLHSMSCSVSG